MRKSVAQALTFASGFCDRISKKNAGDSVAKLGQTILKPLKGFLLRLAHNRISL
jgi:hypothetical protein